MAFGRNFISLWILFSAVGKFSSIRLTKKCRVASLSFVSDESFSCRFEYIGVTFIVAQNDLHARRTFLISGLDSGYYVFSHTDSIKHSAFFYFNICSADGIKMHCESAAR